MKKKSYLVLIVLLFCGCQTGRSPEALADLDASILSKTKADPRLFASRGDGLFKEPTIGEDDRSRLERDYPQTLKKIEQNLPLSLQDVKNLTRSGVKDEAILYHIEESCSIFYLFREDVAELEQAGISQKVIQHMKKTGD